MDREGVRGDGVDHYDVDYEQLVHDIELIQLNIFNHYVLVDEHDDHYLHDVHFLDVELVSLAFFDNPAHQLDIDDCQHHDQLEPDDDSDEHECAVDDQLYDYGVFRCAAYLDHDPGGGILCDGV